MKKIHEIVNNKVKTMIDDGTIEAAVEDGVSKAILTAIGNQFARYGKITKILEDGIEEGLRIDTKNLPFETYNKQMLVIIKQKMGEIFKMEAATQFLKEMDEILKPAPKKMTIVEFVNTIVEFWETEDPWEADDLDEEATVELIKESSTTWTLKMWKQKGSSSYTGARFKNKPDLHLYIIRDVIRLNHCHTFNPTCFRKEEAFVFKLYAAKTMITGIEYFNEDDCELTLKNMDY